MDDTSAEVRTLQIERYRRMSPREKVELVVELGELADMFARAGLEQRHPDADESELRMRLLALKYGEGLVHQAYGWAADD